MAPSGDRSTLIAGRRPALHGRLGWGGVVGAGFALTRDAGRRPALHVRLAWCSVGGAGFALTRDAGRRPALHVRLAWCSVVGAGFALTARCRSETGAPGGGVVGAGFALPRDAWIWSGECPRPRTAPRLVWRSVVGAGFALPRDAGRRPALHARLRLAWCRASQQTNGSGFRAAARCRCVKGGILPFHKTVTTNRNSPKCASGARGSFDCGARAGGWGGFRAPARCRSETGAPCPSFRTAPSRRR